MIIIVEGIDRVGKTTLCNKLEKSIRGFKTYKRAESDFDFSKMDNMNETDKIIQMLEIYSMNPGYIIFDRLHFTDFVYGMLERNYDYGEAKINLEKIEDKLLELDTNLILVQPIDIKESSKQHGRDLKDYARAFDVLYNHSKLRKIMCNYNSIDIVVELMKERFNESVNQHLH